MKKHSGNISTHKINIDEPIKIKINVNAHVCRSNFIVGQVQMRDFQCSLKKKIFCGLNAVKLSAHCPNAMYDGGVLDVNC